MKCADCKKEIRAGGGRDLRRGELDEYGMQAWLEHKTVCPECYAKYEEEWRKAEY